MAKKLQEAGWRHYHDVRTLIPYTTWEIPVHCRMLKFPSAPAIHPPSKASTTAGSLSHPSCWIQWWELLIWPMMMKRFKRLGWSKTFAKEGYPEDALTEDSWSWQSHFPRFQSYVMSWIKKHKCMQSSHLIRLRGPAHNSSILSAIECVIGHRSVLGTGTAGTGAWVLHYAGYKSRKSKNAEIECVSCDKKGNKKADW